MAHSERFEELAALQALGLPLGKESRDFARHLDEGCPLCEELLPEFRAAAGVLSVGVLPRQPRPELREKILASLPSSRFERAPAVPSASRAAWWLAAAAAVLFVFAVWDDARLRRQREDLRSRTAQLSAELSGARAQVFWSEKAKTGFIVAGNLVPLPPDKQYELWVFAEGKPVAAGVFDADRSGRALFESKGLPGLPAAQNFAVTIEPRGCVSQPTGPIILVGTPTAG